MRRSATLISLVLLAGVMQAYAAGLISKSQAEQDALQAVGGGTVTHVHRDRALGKLIWSVDITGTTSEYEVWVDAHTGAILQIIIQPLGPLSHAKPITKAQAEQDALNAVGGGTVLNAHRDRFQGQKIWDIDISQPSAEYTVYVDAYSGAIVKIMQQKQQLGSKYISKSKAEQIALDAVGGGKVLLVRLEKKDNPPVWSVDVKANDGKEYEVKVNAYTGAVVAIIPGG